MSKNGFNTKVVAAVESCNPGAAKKGQRPLGGMGFQAAPPDIFPAVDVELTYSLQFGDTFDPQLGGKLPGLMMAQAGTCKGGARYFALPFGVRLSLSFALPVSLTLPLSFALAYALPSYALPAWPAGPPPASDLEQTM